METVAMETIQSLATIPTVKNLARKSDVLPHPALTVKKGIPKQVHNEITEQLKRQKIRCHGDVEELYLAYHNYVEIPQLGEYKSLHLLWLNNNKIYKVDFLKSNYQLTELYLQNNMIVSIAGTLKHLSCLQILMLHANQLTCPHTTVKELKNMLSLHTLNLFGNPIAQEECYRLFIIHGVCSLKLLDRQSVRQDEVSAARRLFATQLVRIKDSIKFGRRVIKESDQPAPCTYKARGRVLYVKERSSVPPCVTSSNKRDVTMTTTPRDVTMTTSSRRNTTPMSYTYYDWETLGREFLYSKTRSPLNKLTVSIK